MKEQAQEKIQKICDEIRLGTLEPAKKEAENILADAKIKAQAIIDEAEKKAAELIESSRILIQQERNVFDSSLSQGIKQGLEALKQEIDNQLFNEQLDALIKKEMTNPNIIAKLIDSLMKVVEKEGFSADFEALIPQAIPAAEVNGLLAKGILEKLKAHSVLLGSFQGGAQLKSNEKGLTIDMTDQAIKELLSRYIRKDFRKLIFAEDPQK